MADTVIWISGASSGIGAALVRTQPFSDALLVDISRSGGTPGTEHLRADLADPDAWAEVGQDFRRRLGDDVQRAVFVHNAGMIEPVAPAERADPDTYRRNVLVNAAAPPALGQAYLAAVAGWGGRSDLVMLSSGAASSPYHSWSAYCAGKAALEMWVRATGLEQQARAERGESACRVLAVSPGVVATRMQEALRATDEADFPAVDRFRGLHEQGQLTEPDDAARGIWALLDRDLEPGAVVDLRDLQSAS